MAAASMIFLSLVQAQPVFQPFLLSGPTSNRVNLVFLSEGYTAAQTARFSVDATNALNAVLARRPFREYKAFLNAFTLFVPSLQAGSDHPAYGQFRNTYFNSAYDAASDYLITLPPNSADTNYNNGQGKIDALLRAYTPKGSLPLLLVNDPTPGGSDGPADKTAVAYNGAGMADILAHELGHVLAGLGDEYTNSFSGFPDIEEPNTTRETRSDYIKWRAWLAPSTPLPTPPVPTYSGTIGLFEGAHYHRTGWFRPALDCTMNHPNAAFCDVCMEALVLSIYQKARPIDNYSPNFTNLTVGSRAPLSFSIALAPSAPASLLVQWQLDSKTVAAAGTNLLINPAELGDGVHSISVVVRDSTPFVRRDSTNLTQSIQWNLVFRLPWLELKTPLRLNDGRAAFRVNGYSPDGFLLQTADSAGAWRPLATNSFLAGEDWFTNAEPLPIGATFFRAATRPEAVQGGLKSRD